MPRPGWLTLLLGDKGERVAVRFLKKQGYRIVARKSRSRIGELDVVAVDGECIVFVEVKTRSSHVAGQPVEAVTAAKQHQLTRAALAWLKSRGLLERRARFDVIAITWGDGRDPEIQHFRNAFEATGRGQMFS